MATTTDVRAGALPQDGSSCDKCGGFVSAGARFCGTCGQPITEDEPDGTRLFILLGVAFASVVVILSVGFVGGVFSASTPSRVQPGAALAPMGGPGQIVWTTPPMQPNPAVPAEEMKVSDAGEVPAGVSHEPQAGREILGQMAPTWSPGQKVTLDHGKIIGTQDRFRPPVTFKLVMRSHLCDTRLRYAFQQVIFNWEMRPTELRVDGGVLRGGMAPKPGVGQLPPDAWSNVELTVNPGEAVLYVNGQEIDRIPADCSQIDQPFQLEAHNGTLEVRSVAVVQ